MYLYGYTYLCIHVFLQVNTYVRMYAYMYIFMYVYVYIYIHINMHVFMCMYICMLACIDINIHHNRYIKIGYTNSLCVYIHSHAHSHSLSHTPKTGPLIKKQHIIQPQAHALIFPPHHCRHINPPPSSSWAPPAPPPHRKRWRTATSHRAITERLCLPRSPARRLRQRLCSRVSRRTCR